MSIVFDNSIVHDFGVPQTVEDLFRVYGNWSKIHDYEFEDLFSNDEIYVEGNTSWANHALFGYAPNDLTIEYTTDGIGHGVVLQYINSKTYLVCGLAFGNFIIRDVNPKYSGVGYSNIFVKPNDENTPIAGDVRVSFRQILMSNNENDVWNSVSMWVNNKLIGTHMYHVGTAQHRRTRVGLASQYNRTFTNVRVPQLCEYAEWASIDPGEPPMGGLKRSLEGRYIKFFNRWNGALRAWKSKKNVAVAHTFANEDMYAYQRSFDKRELYSHIRILGAWTQAEYIDVDLLSKYGHRFAEINNPYILSEDDCYEKAQDQIARQKETATTEQFESQFTPHLEPEDRIRTPNGDRIITGQSWQYSPGTIDQNLQVRYYAPEYGT